MFSQRSRRRSAARVMARVNERLTNPVMGPRAPYRAPLAQIAHTGRTLSGRLVAAEDPNGRPLAEARRG